MTDSGPSGTPVYCLKIQISLEDSDPSVGGLTQSFNVANGKESAKSRVGGVVIAVRFHRRHVVRTQDTFETNVPACRASYTPAFSATGITFFTDLGTATHVHGSHDMTDHSA